MSNPFAVGRSYNFKVFPADLLGNNFNQVTVLGVINADIAQLQLDINALHAQVYPYLPSGTPNNPRGYDYVFIRTQSGETTVLGITWIDLSTVVEISSGTIIAEIPNCTSSDIQRVREALSANGFSGFNVKMQ